MAEETPNSIEEEGTKKFDIKNLGMGAWIGIAAAALIIGVLIGRFALGGGGAAPLNKTTLTENELDTVVATYVVDGATKSITAKDVIKQTSSLEAAKDEDGNYTIPGADSILNAVRASIINSEAEKKGINPSDEDLLNFAEQTYGLTPDFEAIASTVNTDVDTVKEILRSAYRSQELGKQVSGDASATMPDLPEEPEYKKENDKGEALSDEELAKNREEAYKKANADYAKFIIDLAGDEWDAEKNTWKNPDGDYAQALSSFEIKNDSATYEAVEAAYNVAYSKYYEAQSKVQEAMLNYYNDLYKNSSVTILTLKQ